MALQQSNAVIYQANQSTFRSDHYFSFLKSTNNIVVINNNNNDNHDMLHSRAY